MTSARRGGKTAPFGHQETIGRDTEGSVVVKPAPASAFVMPQAELLFQLLVIAFDDPALLGQAHQVAKLGIGRQSREPILGRFGFCPWPLDQQPFFRMGLATPVIAVSGTNR